MAPSKIRSTTLPPGMTLPPGVSLPPGMSIADIPAMRPPPGVKSNFVNPETSATSLLVINWAFTSLAVLMVFLRVFTRGSFKREQGLGWDDSKSGLFTLTDRELSLCSSDCIGHGMMLKSPSPTPIDSPTAWVCCARCSCDSVFELWLWSTHVGHSCYEPYGGAITRKFDSINDNMRLLGEGLHVLRTDLLYHRLPCQDIDLGPLQTSVRDI